MKKLCVSKDTKITDIQSFPFYKVQAPMDNGGVELSQLLSKIPDSLDIHKLPNIKEILEEDHVIVDVCAI